MKKVDWSNILLVCQTHQSKHIIKIKHSSSCGLAQSTTVYHEIHNQHYLRYMVGYSDKVWI